MFEPFDAAFEAAERHGLGIKATLTANSGPWHIGTRQRRREVRREGGKLRPPARPPR